MNHLHVRPSFGWLPATLALLLCVGCNERATSLGNAVAGTPASASASSQQRDVAIARGKIEIPGGLLEMSPAQDGMVQTVAVEEGQDVKRGQLLLRLATDANSAEIDVAESELKLAQARHQARAQRLPALKRTADRLSEAAAAGAAEPQRAEEAQQALRDAETEVSVAAAEANVARSRLAQVRGQRARHELVAPEAATVVRISTQAGQRWLSQGGPSAITLLPRRPLIVRAEVNESYAAQVRVGQKASVTTDGDASPVALPAAHVVRLSPVLGGARLQDDTQRGPARIVECILEFDTAAVARVGQNVRVNFHE